VQAGLGVGSHRQGELALERGENKLNDKSYQERITYNFVFPKPQQLIHPGPEARVFSSPLFSEMCARRLSLWAGVLGTIVFKQK
ncbi:phenylalanine--tRNA ligase subunit beta, partial [Enterobacter hormaechei]|nr:phenylalanine--tRNA ligase subunit beta [Enterobacter hormaechei]